MRKRRGKRKKQVKRRRVVGRVVLVAPQSRCSREGCAFAPPYVDIIIMEEEEEEEEEKEGEEKGKGGTSYGRSGGRRAHLRNARTRNRS